MKIVLLTFIILSAFGYPKEMIRFNWAQYQRWIRPQLKNIISEYESLFMALSKSAATEEDYLDRIKRVSINWREVQKKCQVDFTPCQSELTKIKDELFKFSSILYLDPTDQAILEHQKAMLVILSQKISTAIDSSLYLKLIGGEEKPSMGIARELNQFINQYYAYFYNDLRHPLGSSFLKAHGEFIKSANLILSEGKPEVFIKEKLTPMNKAWNELHHNLSRGKDPIEGRPKTLAGTIHNRWNNILKMVLIH